MAFDPFLSLGYIFYFGLTDKANSSLASMNPSWMLKRLLSASIFNTSGESYHDNQYLPLPPT